MRGSGFALRSHRFPACFVLPQLLRSHFNALFFCRSLTALPGSLQQPVLFPALLCLASQLRARHCRHGEAPGCPAAPLCYKVIPSCHYSVGYCRDQHPWEPSSSSFFTTSALLFACSSADSAGRSVLAVTCW